MDQKLSNLQIAEMILSSTKREMKVGDIAAEAAIRGLLGSVTVELFTKRLMASLNSSVKRKDSLFSRVKNKDGGWRAGVYKLKQRRPIQLELATPEMEDVADTGFIGRGGEYAVMAELLFRGFNVSLMSVDKGIDIVASNDHNRYFHIQVKTATLSNGGYRFTIDRATFSRVHASNTLYVLVLRLKKSCDFIVMPSSQIRTFMDISVIGGAQKLSLGIKLEGRKYILNNKQDITNFANSFGQIC